MSDSEEDFASADEGEVSHSDSKQPGENPFLMATHQRCNDQDEKAL